MKIKHKIYADALKAMRIPILLHTAATSAEGILTVFTAAILGQFADSVFRLDFSLGTQSAVRLSFTLLAMIVFLPALSLVADMFMLKYALVHDRMVLGRFLDKTYDSILRYELGDIQNRLDWDPCNLRCYLVNYFDKGLMVPVTFAFLLFHALRLSPVYTLIVFALSLLKLAVPLAARKLEGRYENENREYASRLRSLEEEITERSCMVTLYGLGDAIAAKAGKLYRTYFYQTESKSIRLSAGTEAISSFTGTFCTLGILLSGSLLAAEGIVTPGAVAAMYGYSAVFNTLLENVGFLIRNTPILKNTTERLVMFYEDAEENAGEEINRITNICCEGFSYTYEKPRETAFDSSCQETPSGIAEPAISCTGENPPEKARKEAIQRNASAITAPSFLIRQGEKTALCGDNGTGKSTLMKAMLGLLTGYAGSIRINDKELSELNPYTYRLHIAYAPQDPYLFEGTVLENIRIGNPGMPEAELESLMDKMGIASLAAKQVQPGNNGLSGGERQKISIARAVAKGTDLLFLDEPGNNLDQAALDWLCHFVRESGQTIVFISHDSQLAGCADKIVKLDSFLGNILD